MPNGVEVLDSSKQQRLQEGQRDEDRSQQFGVLQSEGVTVFP